MNRTHPLCAVVAVATLALGSALAQSPTAPPAPQPGANAAADPRQQQPQDPAAAPTADPAAQAAAAQQQKEQQQKQEAEQKKQQRLQQIKQVRFDRRPTTMLRTWASPATAGVVTGDPQPPGAPVADGGAPVPTQSVESIVTIGPGAVLVSGSPVAIAPSMPAEPAAAPPASTSTTAPTGEAPNATPAAPAAARVDPFDAALKQWARAVTLGDWPAVKAFLAGLADKDEQKAAWEHLLTSLRTPPPVQGPQLPNAGPQFHFAFEDVLGLAAAAPLPRDDAAFAALGAILQQALQRGLLVEPLLARLRADSRITPLPAGQLTQREAVKLLFAANLQVEAGEFLPAVATAAAESDFEALNLLAQHLVARNAKEGKAALLEEAWTALQHLFAAKDVAQKQKESALRSAVALAPRLRKELGTSWLDASFTADVQRGMDIIASIGVAAAESATAQAQNAPFRQLSLQLQKTAVEALLAAAPERAGQWRSQLSMLGDNWLREAQMSYAFDQSTGYGPRMRRDRYGNFFWYDDSQQNQQVAALPVQQVLDLRPDARWLDQLEPGMQPKFAMLTAQLWLKVQEEAQAFPHIKALAATHPPQAKELVDEFLRVWTRNHDPNEGRHNYYFYGYESRADGIPLTRSKQQRNLEDLARWVKELRDLPIDDPDQQLLAKAFTTCHSSAEVYRLEAIEQVFGALRDLKPATLAALVGQMRQNLATVWRLPNVQEKAKTRRKQKDIEQEVQRGYEVAGAVVDRALQQHADDWSLLLARATLRHDENDYRREIGNDVQYAPRRLLAFADFKAAAQAYQKAVPALAREDESLDVFDHWFNAALGACDLQNILSEHVGVQSEILAVRDHLQALPGDARDRHLERFANNLFTRAGNVKPAVKMRYVKAGLDVVGDHKQAFEARKLFDYYRDITTEIRLQTRVDGPTTVGHGEPFGLFVEIRHTREIERESGGFGRYLRNQNDVGYSYNYGRPTENYRDKFTDMCKQQLGEHFDLLSVTFQNENVHSTATAEYGWRVTPYAYLLLKPRGAQVDRVPALRLDLDFLDTSGYAILPIESPALPIDAAAEHGPVRPYGKVEVTQILDERQHQDGKLLLEIKATANGLPPQLDALLDLSPADFEVANVEDSGPQVTRFDPDAATDTIQAERTWNVTLRAKAGLAQLPTTFRFAAARSADIAVVRQRYADADLVAAAPEIELLGSYGTTRAQWPWYVLGGVLLALLVGAGMALRRRPATVDAGLQVPAQITPFTVLGLLRTIRARPGLDAATAADLDGVIAQVERGYFATDADSATDLRAVASEWVARARQSQAG